MTYNQEELVNSFVEVKLKDEQAFLKIRETLTRIGVASRHKRQLFQSCHILHKRGKYYILHFKQLFLLDQKDADFTENDLARTNTIANLLQSWGLLDLVDPNKSKEPVVPLSQIKILSYKEKNDWELLSKYTVGNKKR